MNQYTLMGKRLLVESRPVILLLNDSSLRRAKPTGYRRNDRFSQPKIEPDEGTNNPLPKSVLIKVV